MKEPIRYVVVCGCTGCIEPVAYINDNRPIGAALTVTGTTLESKQIVSATGYNPTVENWRAPDKFVTDKWAERDVTEIMWNDTRLGWTIRCQHCRKPAEIRETTLAVIADELAANLDPTVVPCPHPEDPTQLEQRHVVQLGSLLCRLSRFRV